MILNGVIIASLVRADVHSGENRYKWTAELLVELPDGERPLPFIEPEHDFPPLDAACDWLEIPRERPNH